MEEATLSYPRRRFARRGPARRWSVRKSKMARLGVTMLRRPTVGALLVFNFTFCGVVGAGQTEQQTHLGKVDFPTSCSTQVQPIFEKAVALMHSFQYQEAQQMFDEAASKEPNCAMAHWGKAMVLHEQLWTLPDKKALSKAHKECQVAEKLHPGTAKEQGFIAAAAAYYQKNSHITYTERTKAYSAGLAKLHEQMPDDVEVGSFYALSLVTLADDDVDSLENQKKAIAILQPLLEKYPDHPGVAHYLIHATDRPELAARGLEAARRYAAIAPDSPHAIHMPSHIFARLGLWQDSITSNIASQESAARLAGEHKAESHYQTHAMDYLNYAYLQSGQETKAREVIAHMDHVVGANDETKSEHRAYLAARTAIELHRWKEAASLREDALRVDQLDFTRWARAIGAARSGDVPGAQTAMNELTASVAERQQRARKSGYTVSTEKPTDLGEADAWLAFAQGKTEEALKEIREAAEHQEKNGGEAVGLPAREMLADMLLELKRPKEALAEYRTVLKNAPNRFDALLGAARAAHAVGDTNEAQILYTKLAEECPPGADRPELAEAKTFVASR
jgi:tetratricopeptide (TPR) repeat protein